MKPKMIILVGLPGSGKSHIASKLFPNCVRISQDELGSRNECLEATRRALNDLKDVVIDRCNMTVEQRKEFLDITTRYTLDRVIAIHLDDSVDACIDRVIWRKGHPTIPETMPYDQKKGIVLRFISGREAPTTEEGFTSVITSKSAENLYQDLTCLL